MRITHAALQQIIEHSRREAPIEACGYLAATDGVIAKVLHLRNVDASPEHFSFEPAEQFAAVREIRNEGSKLAAMYHSHPASPARPSQEDIRLAFDPDLSYVIVSLASRDPVVKSFRIVQGTVIEDPIDVIVGTVEADHVV